MQELSAKDILKDVFGYDAFRSKQLEIIENVVAKSPVYHI
jgi:superfamily II DNA helicase RecQ